MKNVLIAGGAGFIGSHLSKRLLEEGNSITVIDSLISGDRGNVEDLKSSGSFTFLEQDVSSNFINFLSEQKFDEIYHLASPASPNAKSKRSYIAYPIETLLANSIGTYNLLSISLKHKAKFLFASSSEVYGDPSVSPQTESYFGNVNPNGPRSVYDEGKRFGEAMAMGFVRKYDVDARIVRIFNTYGPKMQPDDGRVVSNFINQALKNENITVYGDGTQTRSFCYVSDMVEGLKSAMEKGRKGEVYNIGNPDERSVKDVADLVVRLCQSQAGVVHEELPEDDPKKRKPDITKAQQDLGFNPVVRFEEGLEKTIQYFKGRMQ